MNKERIFDSLSGTQGDGYGMNIVATKEKPSGLEWSRQGFLVMSQIRIGREVVALEQKALPLATAMLVYGGPTVGTQKTVRIKSSQEITWFNPSPAPVFE